MNFKITKLEIENFRSIQDKVTLSLKPGLFSIEGINYTETNSTNGCGKSTLISALFWAFTGSSLTNEVLADEVVNLKTNKNCRVSVYVETEKDEIKVTRVRKDVDKGNNLILEINGQDLSCHKVDYSLYMCAVTCNNKITVFYYTFRTKIIDIYIRIICSII